MVQIIDGGPTKESLRQKAFADDLAQMQRGVSGIGNAIAQQRETERQLALQKERQRMSDLGQALSLSKMSGQSVTPDMISQFREGGMPSPVGEMGPEQPSGLYAAFEGLKSRQEMERQQKELARKQKEEQFNIDKAYKGAQMRKMQADAREAALPFEQSREGQKYLAQQGVKDKETQKKEARDLREREIPGLGLARTRKEAQDVRSANAAVMDAHGLIERIKELGTGVNITDREKIGKINQLKTALIGKLRVPLTGPGILTEQEFNRLMDNIGDPSNLFSTEKREIAKLDQLKNVLSDSVKSHYSSVADIPSGEGQPQMMAATPQQTQPKITYSPGLAKKNRRI